MNQVICLFATGQGPATRLAVGGRGTVRLDSRIDAGFFCTVTVAGHVFRGAPRQPCAKSCYLYLIVPLTYIPRLEACGQFCRVLWYV